MFINSMLAGSIFSFHLLHGERRDGIGAELRHRLPVVVMDSDAKFKDVKFVLHCRVIRAVPPHRICRLAVPSLGLLRNTEKFLALGS